MKKNLSYILFFIFLSILTKSIAQEHGHVHDHDPDHPGHEHEMKKAPESSQPNPQKEEKPQWAVATESEKKQIEEHLKKIVIPPTLQERMAKIRAKKREKTSSGEESLGETALAKIAEAAKEYQDFLKEKEKNVQGIISFGEKAMPFVLEKLGKGEHASMEASILLIHIVSKIQPDRRCHAAVREWLSKAKFDQRIESTTFFREIVEMNIENIVPALNAGLSNAMAENKVKFLFSFWLASQKSQENTKDSLKALLDFTQKGDPLNVQAALNVLAMFLRDEKTQAEYKQKTIERLVDMAQKSTSPSQTIAILTTLGQSKQISVVQHLTTFLFHGNIDIVNAAVKALGNFGKNAESAVEMLLSLLQSQSFMVQKTTIATLGRIQSHKAVPALINLLKSDNKQIVYHARKSLWEITGKNFGYNPEAWQAWWESYEKSK